MANIAKYTSLLIIGAGILLLISQLYPLIIPVNTSAVNLESPTNKQVASVKTTQDEIPEYIKIDSINLKSPIVKSQMENGNWVVNDNIVNLSTDPSNPNIFGDFSNNNKAIILFGHRKDIFLYLPSVKAGDKIELMNLKTQREYTVVSANYVPVTEVSVLNTKFPNELILYTCDYFTDSRRFVVIAKEV